MRLTLCFTCALLVLGGCGNDVPDAEKSATPAAQARLPDAAPPDTTLPAFVSPATGSAAADSGAISSVYTSLVAADCRVIEVDEEAGGSVSRCPGAAGHALKVLESDLRMSIDVVTPDGKEHPLNYWGVITGNFSSLGPRAEWRMRGGRPIALIVRVNASEDPEDSSRLTSYLAVARITPREICVTDRIGPAPDANVAARAAADRSAGRTCAKAVP